MMCRRVYDVQQLFTKSILHSNLPRDISIVCLFGFFCLFCCVGFFCKTMFAPFWLIKKAVVIRFSHRKQCLISTSFHIMLSAPFFWTIFASVSPNVCSYYTLISKGDFITKRKRLIQTALS